MGLFTFNINVHSDEDAIKKLVALAVENGKNIQKIMANVQELSDAVDALQVQLDAVQEQVTATIGGLDATIADLTSQLANGATPDQVQALLAKVNAIKDDLATTLPTA